MKRVLILIALGSLSASVGCFKTFDGDDEAAEDDSESDSSCLVGSQGCACTPGGACDDGLTCEAKVCVSEADSSESTDSADTTDTAESTESSDSTGSTDTSESTESDTESTTDSSDSLDTTDTGSADECDPLLQDCELPGQGCFHDGESFVCAMAFPGEPSSLKTCAGFADCIPGQQCLPSAFVGGPCQGRACCTEYCSLSDPECNPISSCTLLLPMNDAYADIGVCTYE